MTAIDWKRKLSSRKLWAAAAGIVTGLAMVFGLDEGTINTVAGAVVSLASVVAYIMVEGKVDAAGVKNAREESLCDSFSAKAGEAGPTVEGVQDAAEAVSDGNG